jgi:hypothetical protein
MATPPTSVHDWTRMLQVDPTSGKDNYAEPPEPLKDYGWPRKARPARQHLNYLFRTISQWLHWIENEWTAFMPLIDTLESDLETETTNRIGADGVIAGLVSTEAGDRETADGVLQGNIEAEAEARETADGVLQGNIGAEASLRAGVDGDLAIAIGAETLRLDYYDEDTVDLSGVLKLTGFSADQSVNYYATIKRHRATNTTPGLTLTEVLLYLPKVVTTSTAATMTIAAADIPAGLRPDVDQVVPLCVKDDGDNINGHMQVSITGDWIIRRFDDADWITSGNKGIQAQLIRYRLSVA